MSAATLKNHVSRWTLLEELSRHEPHSPRWRSGVFLAVYLRLLFSQVEPSVLKPIHAASP